MKNVFRCLVFVLVFLLNSGSVFAHAVVKPATVGVGSFTDFTLGVPSEKDASTISVKLFIPEGINSVSPIVKPGWNVQVLNSDKQGEPDDDGNTNPIPEAIVWTGGAVPPLQKDFFMFSTQVPTKETELIWKVEQSYSDGTIVSWTMSPDDTHKDGQELSGPYSVTKVINDLAPVKPAAPADTQSNLPLTLSIAALALSTFSLLLNYRKK